MTIDAFQSTVPHVPAGNRIFQRACHSTLLDFLPIQLKSTRLNIPRTTWNQTSQERITLKNKIEGLQPTIGWARSPDTLQCPTLNPAILATKTKGNPGTPHVSVVLARVSALPYQCFQWYGRISFCLCCQIAPGWVTAHIDDKVQRPPGKRFTVVQKW